MDIKNNKGYVLTDASIAIIVLLILVPVIMGFVYGINSTRNTADIKAEALSIATNAIEEAKGIGLENLADGQAVITSLGQENGLYKMESNLVNPATIITDKASYKLQVGVKDYNEQNPEATVNIVKTVTATVQFKTKGKEQTIELSTVLK